MNELQSEAPPVPLWKTEKHTPVGAGLRGIGGWLGLFAFGLVFGVLREMADAAKELRDIKDQIDLVVYAAVTLPVFALQIATVVTFFQKRRIFLILYRVLTGVVVLSLALIAAFGDVAPNEGAKLIAGLFAMGLWNWYLLASVRVKNTFVN